MIRHTLANKREKAALAAVLAAALVALILLGALRRSDGGVVAVVTYDGKQVAEFKLDDYTGAVKIPMRQLGEDVPVSFELRDHQIRFVDVDCPDHLCEGFGFIGMATQTAVCLPNRVAVSITEG